MRCRKTVDNKTENPGGPRGTLRNEGSPGSFWNMLTYAYAIFEETGEYTTYRHRSLKIHENYNFYR
jgi:hypothetical protein